MKTIVLSLIGLLFIATQAFCGATTYVFTMTSSAKTATPNLRIALQSKTMATDNNAIAIPHFTRDITLNYYLTKSTTVILSNSVAARIQVDQNTKVYKGTDLTNYMLFVSGTEYTDGIR